MATDNTTNSSTSTTTTTTLPPTNNTQSNKSSKSAVSNVLDLFTVDPFVRDEYIKFFGGNGSRTIFSFINGDSSMASGGVNFYQIYPLPQSFYKYCNNDFSLNRAKNASSGSTNSLTAETLLNDLPSILIRSYMVDSPLNEILNGLASFMKGFEEATGESGSIADKPYGTLGSMEKKIKEISYAIQAPNGINSLNRAIYSNIGGMTPKAPFNEDASQNNASILALPYSIYYNVTNSQTLNWYKLPVKLDGSFFNSNGAYGWDSSGSAGAGGAAGLLSKIVSSVKTNFSPIFNPSSSQGDSKSFTIEVDLINDNIISAVHNYIFVQSLFLANLWIQYGILQASSALYDITLGGIRYFMCTGEFECAYKGIVRKIPGDFINKIPIFAGKLPILNNNTDAGNSYRYLQIPDVYSLKLTFKSLLPNNFNNMIMGYAFGDNFGDVKSTPGLGNRLGTAIVKAFESMAASGRIIVNLANGQEVNPADLSASYIRNDELEDYKTRAANGEFDYAKIKEEDKNQEPAPPVSSAGDDATTPDATTPETQRDFNTFNVNSPEDSYNIDLHLHDINIDSINDNINTIINKEKTETRENKNSGSKRLLNVKNKLEFINNSVQTAIKNKITDDIFSKPILATDDDLPNTQKLSEEELTNIKLDAEDTANLTLFINKNNLLHNISFSAEDNFKLDNTVYHFVDDKL